MTRFLHFLVFTALSWMTYGQASSLPSLGSNLDTLHILRDYDPHFSYLNESGSDISWSITNQFSAPFIRQNFVEKLGDSNFRIINEFGDSKYFYQNGNKVQLIKTDFLQLNDQLLLRGNFIFVKPLLDYMTNPSFGKDDMMEGVANAIYSPGTIATDQLALFSAEKSYQRDATFKIEANIVRDVVRNGKGTLQYLFVNDKVIFEKCKEKIELSLFKQVGDKWESVGKPRNFTKEFYYFIPDGKEFYPVLMVMKDPYNEISYADYLLRQQYQYLPKLAEPSKSRVQVYPNPTDKMYVKFEFNNMKSGLYKIDVYNILGQQLDSNNFTLEGTDTYTMDVSNLSQGTYLYRIIDPDGKVLFTRRFVVLEP